MSILESSHQEQDQQDNDHQPESAAAIVAGTVKGPAAQPAKPAKQNNH